MKIEHLYLPGNPCRMNHQHHFSFEADVIHFFEVPPELYQIDIQYKAVSRRIAQVLECCGEPVTLVNGSDLLDGSSHVLSFVKNGIFKLYYRDKLIRFFEADDCILFATQLHKSEFKCISEFSVETLRFTHNELIRQMTCSATLCEQLLLLTTLQTSLLQILCSINSNDEPQSDAVFQPFAAGSRIISEGEPAHEIYMLVQGTAKVTVKEFEVGTIKPGEVFGEISFFTNSTRTATVTAETACLVQVMHKNDFISLVKKKPSVQYAITKTLSERLVATNQKILKQST